MGTFKKVSQLETPASSNYGDFILERCPAHNRVLPKAALQQLKSLIKFTPPSAILKRYAQFAGAVVLRKSFLQKPQSHRRFI